MDNHLDGVCTPHQDAAVEIGVRLAEEVYQFAKSQLPPTRPGSGMDSPGQGRSAESPRTPGSPADTISNQPTDTRNLIENKPVDDSARKAREAVDRDKLEDIAKKLNESAEVSFLTFFPFGEREEGPSVLVKDLSPTELQVLDGIYYQKYGTTLRLERGLRDDREFRKLLDRDTDPVARKSGRMMDLIDEQSGSSNPYSGRVQKLRDTLSAMNADEIRQVDDYFQSVYGKNLHDAITSNKHIARTSRDICEILLKGQDRLYSEDYVKLDELQEKDRQGKLGNPDSDLKASDLKELFVDNFADLDKDKNGYVSKDEIDRAMADEDFKGKNAQLIAVLKDKREDIEELSNDEIGDEDDGITKADMKALAKLADKSDKDEDEQELVDGVDKMLHRSGRVLSKYGDASLWGPGDDPLKNINPDAVQQGNVGSCYFLAGIASLSSTPEGKQSLKNMIEDQGGGRYKVTFPGDPENPIIVDEPTPSELAYAAEPTKHGMWVAVLEKAYARRADKDAKVPYGAIEGGLTDEGLKILTGKSTDTDYLSATRNETTHEKLTAAMRDGRFVTAGIRPELAEGWGWADGKTDNAGLPTQHVYSVVGYNPETRMVKVRNPWGCGEPENYCADDDDDGTFEMSLEDFNKNFTNIAYTEK